MVSSVFAGPGDEPSSTTGNTVAQENATNPISIDIPGRLQYTVYTSRDGALNYHIKCFPNPKKVCATISMIFVEGVPYVSIRMNYKELAGLSTGSNEIWVKPEDYHKSVGSNGVVDILCENVIVK